MIDIAPNPGSDQAQALGCTCPVLDNCHGKFPPILAGTTLGGEEGAWHFSTDCPVHAVDLASRPVQ